MKYTGTFRDQTECVFFNPPSPAQCKHNNPISKLIFRTILNVETVSCEFRHFFFFLLNNENRFTIFRTSAITRRSTEKFLFDRGNNNNNNNYRYCDNVFIRVARRGERNFCRATLGFASVFLFIYLFFF